MNFDIVVLEYGIVFGILMMSIFYTFIRYLYSREVIYASYSLLQIFSLVYIAAYSNLFGISENIQELFLILAVISAVIFAIAFYEGRFTPVITNYKELILNTFLLSIIILTVLYHYILFEYIPYTVMYAILSLSVIFNLKQNFNPTVIYVIGWLLVCLFLFIFDMKTYFIQHGYTDMVLMAFAIEAIFFTTSISYKYVLLKNEISDSNNIILQQSKLVKSGEMIVNIAHQFRQPLHNISYILMNLNKKLQNGSMNFEYFNKKFRLAEEQLQFLSKTIDNFREFYMPSKHKENFCVKSAIDNSLTIISADLKQRDIKLELQFQTNENIKVYGIKNELSQVILALISNASDALLKVENPWIKVTVKASSAEVLIIVEDNAKGINEKNLKKIFEPYYSTKENGIGIGLYLAKMIIEKSFDGKIEVNNTKEGAKFTLHIEKVI